MIFARSSIHVTSRKGEEAPSWGLEFDTANIALGLRGTPVRFFGYGDKLMWRSRDDTLQSRSSGFRTRSHALTQSLGGTLSRRPIQAHVEKVRLANDTLLLLALTA